MARNEKLALLGQPVRAHIGGHMSTVFLTDYEQASDSYWGEAHRNRKTGEEETPVVTPVRGLRPYPYSRSDYPFQFVLPGEDEQPLLDIAEANKGKRGAQSDERTLTQTANKEKPEVTPVEGTPPEIGADVAQTIDPADANKDGVVTKKERKQFNKQD